MAIEIPPVYLSDYRARRTNGGEPKWRLSRDHIEDIKDIARGVEESNVGVCCRYLIDHLIAIGSADVDEDGYIHHLDPIENFCQKYEVWSHPTVLTWRKRIERCRRAFRKMREADLHEETSVLFVVYGYPDPSIRELPKKVSDALGELTPLARYTNRVEVQRKELARLEAIRMASRQSKIAETKDLPQHWKKNDDEISEFDERAQSGDEITRRAIHQGLPVQGASSLVDLMRHRDLYEYALRVISSGEALDSLFAPLPSRGENETKEHFDVRIENAKTKQDVILSEIKVEAHKMLKNASIAFHGMWLRSL